MTTEDPTFLLGSGDIRQGDEALWQFLTTHSTSPVRIDLSAVAEVTGTRLQLLISASRQRGLDGLQMRLVGMSETFRNSLARLGVPPGFFEEEGLS
jgi:anti-anti-sigma regulatory factor